MERCEICAGEINSSIFRGTKVDCEICRKIRAQEYENWWVALSDVANSNMSEDRQDKAGMYITRRIALMEDSNA